MKIFNWVQRRIRPSDSCRDGFVGNVNKAESIRNDADKQMVAEVLDGWKDSMLTIGTLGFDLLIPSDQQIEYSVLKGGDEGIQKPDDYEEEDDDDEDSSNEDEANPLMTTTFQVNGWISDSEAEKPEIDCVVAFDNPQRKLRGERTTLAELFIAESDQDLKIKADSATTATMEPNSGKKKQPGFPFAKKLKHHVAEKDDSSRPVKKIRHMVKKLLKRKIHPVIQESKQSCVSDHGNHQTHKTDESICLLQPRPGPTI
ncbi:Protein TILLER ANGLE CONTROL 1 [Linum grandiflorum]